MQGKIYKLVEVLLDHDVVRDDHFVHGALTHITWECLCVNGSEWLDAPETLAHRVLMNAWIAVGEILGVLRDLDVPLMQEDSRAVVPRAFVEIDATDDEIEKHLRKAEEDLSRGAEGDFLPKYVIAAASPVIEGLTKRVWPNAFQSNDVIAVASVLHSHLHDQTPEFERRFASIAVTLYTRYRNVAQHEVERVKLSYDEARFFVAGIRTLLNLSKRIAESRSSGA